MDSFTPFSHEYFMRSALRQAERAADAGEVPIGAVIVHQGQIIAKGYNQVETLGDPTAHAEMIAISAATQALKNWRLSGCTLYVTKEPCPMCAGACVNARLDAVHFALPDERGGGCGGAFGIHQHPGLLHRYGVHAGLLQDEALELLQSFFKDRRQAVKAARNSHPS